MLPYYVKPKGFWWGTLPIKKNFASTVFQTIYLPKYMYDNLQSPTPNIHYQALLLHEEEHRKRLKRNPLLWYLKYIGMAKFRFEEEIIAYKIQQKFLNEHDETLDIEKISHYLSSGIYLWCTTTENAKEKLSA